MTSAYDEVLRHYEPVDRSRKPHVRAGHRVQDVLRAARRSSALNPKQRKTCPVCLGLPGCIASGQRGGNRVDDQDRPSRSTAPSPRGVASPARNYFYPDMPRTSRPRSTTSRLCVEGLSRTIEVDGPRQCGSGIETGFILERRQPGKNTHVGWGDRTHFHGADYSLVDYNRAGIPAGRDRHQNRSSVPAGWPPIVARTYVTELRENPAQPWGVSDVRMEQGSLRCDGQHVAQSSG